MKRIITLVLSLIFILQGITVTAAVPANDYARLESFGFIPEGFESKDMSAAATREDLAFMLAKLMKVGEMSPIKTQFEDVEETSPYSGYINILNKAGVISGESATRFNPKGSFTLATADRLVVKILGYTGIAKDEEQCVNLTTRLRMNDNVQVLDNKAVTNNGLVQFIHNVIEADLPNVTFNDAEQTVPVYSISDERSVLGTWLGISAYYGTIDEVNDKDREATVTITKNKYDANSKKLAEGSSHTFKGAGNINLNKFLNVPSILWVDKNDTIIAMEYEMGIEVKAGFIFSINEDERENAEHSGAFIKDVVLTDSDTVYKVADGGMRFLYNFKETDALQSLVGKFARIVLKNGKIIVMDVLQMKEGGVIKTVEGTKIVYTKGAINDVVLKDVDKASKRLVFIDGENADIKDLRNESVFCYYKSVDGEIFVIVSSHRRATDVLESYKSGAVQVGNTSYELAKTFYYSTDGKTFSSTVSTNPGVLSPLLNMIVNAYFHPSGKCVYIAPASPEDVKSNKRIGILLGSKTETFGGEQVNLLLLEPTIEKKIVEVSEHLRVNLDYLYKNLYGGSTLAADIGVAENASGTVAWEAIKTKSFSYNQNDPFVLEFDIRNDKLVEVSKPLHYRGYAPKFEIDHFANQNNASLARTLLHENYGVYPADAPGLNTTLYFGNVPFIFLYEKDGMVEAKNMPWHELYGKAANGTKLMPFGYEKKTGMRLALFYGPTNAIGASSDHMRYGVVMGKGLSLDADGEVCATVNIVTSSGEQTYKIDINNTLPEYAFIEYTVGGLLKEADEITVSDGVTVGGMAPIDLTAEVLVEDVANNFYIGTVTYLDEDQIGLDDDEFKLFFFNKLNSVTFYERIRNTRGVSFETIGRDEISLGDKIAFYRIADGVQMVIVTEKAAD